MNDDIVSKASAAGQNYGAVARAGAISAVLATRDFVANTAAPRAKSVAAETRAVATVGVVTVAVCAKAGAAFAFGFVRNVLGK